MFPLRFGLSFFFFNDTATTEIYTLSLHDALPISRVFDVGSLLAEDRAQKLFFRRELGLDRKSTRLNSSHANISYAVFCLKKKKKNFRMPVAHLCINTDPCLDHQDERQLAPPTNNH